jgi:hypothetical protein
MTLWAERKANKQVVIHHSPSDTHIVEDVVHMRAFHAELGKLLSHIESGSSEPASTPKPTEAEMEEANSKNKDGSEPSNVAEQEAAEVKEDKADKAAE